MMSTLQLAAFIGAMSVAMVTCAPVASQEQADSLIQSDDAVDRAKRAQETVYFGNQQNKPRVLVKKSDLSSLLLADRPSGESDQGGQVIAHAQVPVEEDLAVRAEAALGKEEEDEKMAEAMESAMQSAVDAVVNENVDDGNDGDEESQAGSNDEDSPQGGEESEQSVDNVADEEEEEEEEEETNQQTEEENVQENEEEEVNEDTEEKDLQEAAENLPTELPEESDDGVEEGKTEDVLEEGDGQTEGGTEAEEEGGNQLLQQLDNTENNAYPYEALYPGSQPSGMESYPVGVQSPYNGGDRNVYDQLMMSPYGASDLYQTLPYMYYRRRRRSSLGAGRHDKSRRRIKRDLMDDNYLPYIDGKQWDSDDYEYMYKMLVSLLAEDYVKQLQEEEEETPYESFAEEQVPLSPEYVPEGNENEYRIGDDDFYVPEEVLSAYEQGYDPYAAAGIVPEDLDDDYRIESKRGMVDFYPQEMDKRYFFPFSDEPETHWGAFVPEKRDYGEAIQRLQRLALALSDNQGPYSRDFLEGYKKK